MKNLIVAFFIFLSFLAALTLGQNHANTNSVNTSAQNGATKIELTINLDGLSNAQIQPIRNRQRPNRVTRTRRRVRPFTRTRNRPQRPQRFTSILITQTPSTKMTETTTTTVAPALAGKHLNRNYPELIDSNSYFR